ncbi:McrC family protein [Natronobacterium texcoconense]|uniref:5-methylcytosine-specific restriction enzyme subunit McrC n=1 Tax=Natronobacterium texcoconense TaxID=1095778 RepID=A0A1H1FZS8_NATTX|nr:restriction endonuclease [Natronobacterium texcoconense]SDR06066.1 5-methylcytosine-specific restriction enzyme subunit McrC [Natronobacterium texcoconense]
MSIPVPRDETEIAADIELGEYEESDPIELGEQAARMLTHDVNGGSDRDGDRIKLWYTRDGKAVLKATQYVGIVSLPDGPVIQVRPKAAGTNLLYLLQYAQDTTPTTFASETPFQRGPTFLDAFGALFEAELRDVLNRGLRTDYRRVDNTESHLRGQLNVQQQLQRHPPTPTKFECTYDELTHDTTANQAILYATSVLLGIVSDQSITQALRQHQQLLRRRVELIPVTSAELDGIQLTRLSEHYEDILRLSRLVIKNAFVSELTTGSSTSFSLLVNMNTVFENAIERAVTTVAEQRGWTVKPQEKTQSLLTRGKHNVTLKPDVTIYEGERPLIVGDAKWKTDTPSNSDYYQLTSYMLGRDTPGILFYPNCDGKNTTTAEVARQFPLEIVELPTAAAVDGFDEFVEQFEDAVGMAIDSILEY